MKRLKVSRLSSAAAVVGLLAVAGSASASAAVKAKPAAALINLTIGYAAPSADQMIVEVAAQEGFFKKYGINANVEFLQQSLLFPAMVSGQVEYGVAAGPGPEVLHLNGTALEYIGQWEQSNDVVVMGGSSIGTSPQSANGKSVSISSAGSLSDFMIQLYEQKYNIKMTEVPLGNITNAEAAFTSGAVKALSGASPWQESSIESAVPGSHVLYDFRNIKSLPAMGVVAYQPYASTHSSTDVKVLEAFIGAVAYWKTHPSQCTAIIAQYTSEPTAEAAQAYASVKGLLTSTITPSLQDQKNVLKLMTPDYPAAASFNATSLLNTSYATKAIAALKPKPKKKTKKK